MTNWKFVFFSDILEELNNDVDTEIKHTRRYLDIASTTFS